MDIYSENIFQECPKSSDRYPTANVIKCGGLHIGRDRCHNAKGHLHTGVLFSHQYYLFRIQFHPFRLTRFIPHFSCVIFLGGDFKNLLLTTVKLNSTLEQFDDHVQDFQDFLDFQIC